VRARAQNRPLERAMLYAAAFDDLCRLLVVGGASATPATANAPAPSATSPAGMATAWRAPMLAVVDALNDVARSARKYSRARSVRQESVCARVESCCAFFVMCVVRAGRHCGK
jgi:hypothetical protein